MRSLFSRYWIFIPIAMLAAIVANATGAGGGIVFLPALVVLGLDTQQSVATSIAIQCFGMSSGALSWLNYKRIRGQYYGENWGPMFTVVALGTLGSCFGVLLVQWSGYLGAVEVKKTFSWFSLGVAVVVVGRTLVQREEDTSRVSLLSATEKAALFVLSLGGGCITAWVSIGVGEILAVALMLMGYRTYMAIASAVCVSAISVVCALPYHIFVSDQIEYDILLFAGPAALLGGALARKLAVRLGLKSLKYFIGYWIAASAVVVLST